MHGNVYQWCDTLSEKGSTFHVARGGAWCNRPNRCRAAYRGRAGWSGDFDNGLRVLFQPN
jgi:formylglycine-generating enzyme required for sulfatase activity